MRHYKLTDKLLQASPRLMFRVSSQATGSSPSRHRWPRRLRETGGTVLYVVYLAIAVAMATLYLLVEPYLLYSFRGKALISSEEITELARKKSGRRIA